MTDQIPAPLVRSARPQDAAACAAIYAPYVADTVITFETEAPGAEAMAARIAEAQARHAWLVAEVDRQVVGYAYGQRFHPRPGYRWSCETSVYMAMDRRGQGGGRALYGALLARLGARGYRRALAGIAQPNPASNGIHRAFGFQDVALYRRVGWKHGAWHDVAWMELDRLPSAEEVDPPREIT